MYKLYVLITQQKVHNYNPNHFLKSYPFGINSFFKTLIVFKYGWLRLHWLQSSVS